MPYSKVSLNKDHTFSIESHAEKPKYWAPYSQCRKLKECWYGDYQLDPNHSLEEDKLKIQETLREIQTAYEKPNKFWEVVRKVFFIKPTKSKIDGICEEILKKEIAVPKANDAKQPWTAARAQAPMPHRPDITNPAPQDTTDHAQETPSPQPQTPAPQPQTPPPRPLSPPPGPKTPPPRPLSPPPRPQTPAPQLQMQQQVVTTPVPQPRPDKGKEKVEDATDSDDDTSSSDGDTSSPSAGSSKGNNDIDTAGDHTISISDKATSAPVSRLKSVFNEFIRTEATYQDQLSKFVQTRKILKQRYILNKYIEPKQANQTIIRDVYSNLKEFYNGFEELKQISETFLNKFQNNEMIDLDELCDFFLNSKLLEVMEPMIGLHQQFTDLSAAIHVGGNEDSLTLGHHLDGYIEGQTPHVKKGAHEVVVESLAIAPFQRLPRYLLLIKEILKELEEDSPHRPKLILLQKHLDAVLQQATTQDILRNLWLKLNECEGIIKDVKQYSTVYQQATSPPQKDSGRMKIVEEFIGRKELSKIKNKGKLNLKIANCFDAICISIAKFNIDGICPSFQHLIRGPQGFEYKYNRSNAIDSFQKINFDAFKDINMAFATLKTALGEENFNNFLPYLMGVADKKVDPKSAEYMEAQRRYEILKTMGNCDFAFYLSDLQRKLTALVCSQLGLKQLPDDLDDLNATSPEIEDLKKLDWIKGQMKLAFGIDCSALQEGFALGK